MLLTCCFKLVVGQSGGLQLQCGGRAAIGRSNPSASLYIQCDDKIWDGGSCLHIATALM